MADNTGLKESTIQADGLKIDRDAGIVYGVKVCGNRSRNGRIYPTEVLEKAAPLYDRVSVYLDHGYESGEERPMAALVGCLRNPRVDQGELFADLHYIKSHEAAASIVELAERFPNNFGLSHDVIPKREFRDGVEVITAILKVHSVDVVTRPATNDGIFEQEQKTPMKKRKTTYGGIITSLPVKQYPGKFRVLESLENADDPMMDTPVELEESDDGSVDSDAAIMSALEQALVAICKDSNLDRKTKLKKLGEVLKQQETLTGSAPADPPADDGTTEMDDETEEGEGVVEEDGEDKEKGATESVKLKKLRAENARLKSKLKTSNIDAAVESVIRSRELTSTPQLREALRNFDTVEKMNAYLDGEGDEVGPVRESLDFSFADHDTYIPESKGSGDGMTREERLRAIYSAR